MKPPQAILSVCSTLLFASVVAYAETASDRFSAITGRNVFRLNPPKLQTGEVVPPPNRPQITLQGITTILGRMQALLTIQPRTKSAESLQTSCILAQGDNRLDVVVLEINAELGTVRVNNLGSEQILALKH